MPLKGIMSPTGLMNKMKNHETHLRMVTTMKVGDVVMLRVEKFGI